MTASSFSVVDEANAEAVWFLGTLARIRVNAESTNGALDMVEFLHPAGFASPLHIHVDADEMFLILEGTLRGVCDGEEVIAHAGATVWLPKGSVHAYAAMGSEPLRMLAMTMPGSFSNFVREAGTPALELQLPPADMPIDFAKVEGIAGRNGISFVGPPVTQLTEVV